jgi:hypothetical protein
VLQYAPLARANGDSLQAGLAVILAMLGGLLRLLVEPVMVGAIGLLCGAVVSPRIVSLTVGTALIYAYFLFVNLLRLLPLGFSFRLLVEIGLPLLLPAGITWAALTLASRALRRD